MDISRGHSPHHCRSSASGPIHPFMFGHTTRKVATSASNKRHVREKGNKVAMHKNPKLPLLTMTTIRFRSVLPALVVLLLSCPLLAYSFIPYTTTRRSQVATVSSSSRLFLYDKPLPPRPSPRDDDNDSSSNNNNDDNDQPYPIQQRLFEFDLQGKEKQNLLPRLSRTLESGIGCYYESTDRKVQNLVKKTDCHPDDAAWALEACKGDITEAWTCISTARRQQLNSNDDNFMSIANKKMGYVCTWSTR